MDLECKVRKMSRYSHANAKGERKYMSYSFFTLTLQGVSDQRHPPAALYTREWTSSTHWIGGCVGLTVVLDTETEGITHCLCRDRTPVVQSIVRQYTDWATPADIFIFGIDKTRALSIPKQQTSENGIAYFCQTRTLNSLHRVSVYPVRVRALVIWFGFIRLG
jgi:hypothetical protein